jgi:hypothetical protein
MHLGNQNPAQTHKKDAKMKSGVLRTAIRFLQDKKFLRAVKFAVFFERVEILTFFLPSAKRAVILIVTRRNSGTLSLT